MAEQPKPPRKRGKGPPKGEGGRPPIEIQQRQFESLCAIACTEREICCVLGVSEDTICRWCMATYGKTFAEVYPDFVSHGNMSIRRKQFELAMAGDRKMLEILGQNRLNQTKKVRQQNDTTLHSQIIDAIHGKREEE